MQKWMSAYAVSNIEGMQKYPLEREDKCSTRKPSNTLQKMFTWKNRNGAGRYDLRLDSGISAAIAKHDNQKRNKAKKNKFQKNS